MITISDARREQQKITGKILIHFVFSLTICGIFFVILFSLTNWLSISSAFLVLPSITVIIIIDRSRVLEFLSKKEFIGKLVDIEIYSVRRNTVKGVGWGYPNSQITFKVAKVTVSNEQGKVLIKTFRNGDVTNKLSLGDEIAILRFIDDQPILIHSNHNSNLQ